MVITAGLVFFFLKKLLQRPEDAAVSSRQYQSVGGERGKLGEVERTSTERAEEDWGELLYNQDS